MQNKSYSSANDTLQSLYSSFTTGSVLFEAGSAVAQNNANFFWDNTNIRLGIGTNAPTSAIQIVASAAGAISSNITNSSASNSASASFNLTNANGATGALSIFANGFVASYLSNATRVAGSNALWFSSDVNVASGGTDNIVFSAGGYNNVIAQITPSYLTAISIQDTGIAASAAGAPLSITSGQILTSGVYNTEVNSSSALTISTTAGTIGGATVTPVAGNYLVIFSCNITASSAAGNILRIQMSVGGTAQADTLRTSMPIGTGAFAAFQNMSPSTNKIVTVNGSQAIAITASTSAGTITVTGLNFDVVRLA